MDFKTRALPRAMNLIKDVTVDDKQTTMKLREIVDRKSV